VAQEKYERCKSCGDWQGGIAKLSQCLNVDLSAYPLDEPFNSIHAIINMLKRIDGQLITPRILGEKMAFCGFGPMSVGTPEMVADVMEDWVNNGDVHSFNIAYVSNPESYEDLVELLVPVLQERGLMWDRVVSSAAI
jgi:alkanesulfonate monooxygenase SsuD/methylene tetrahydromethanopterin reductase-like flavin-dependent oxidoreductase (luciferase family)